MRLGFIGLGKMGGFMVERLLRDGHEVVAYARTAESVSRAVAKGAKGANDLPSLCRALQAPRVIWLMWPAGAAGSGHLVKMVHNGVEYGMMQAYAEGFDILKASPYGLDMRGIAHLWNQGSVVRSWLLELAERAFTEDPGLEKIRGYVEDSGE